MLSSIYQKFQICYPHISNFTFSFSDMFHTGTRFTSMRFLSHNSLALLYQALVFLMGLHCCHIQDPSSCNSIFTQPKKLLVYHAHTFSLHTCSGFQTISKLCILTIKSHLSIQSYKIKGFIIPHICIIWHTKLFQMQSNIKLI
jgi:hypothetical protein